MDKLPLNDIPMLVSAINFLLRDHEFETLDQICYHFNVDRKELEAKMATQGFEGRKNKRNFGKSYDYNIQVSHVQKL